VIHEAIDAAFSLAQALAVLLLLFAATATAALYALVVATVLACTAVTRGCAACLAAVQRAGVPEAGPEPQKTADGHAVPTWARTDKEAA
jgi:hypothetical protein